MEANASNESAIAQSSAEPKSAKLLLWLIGLVAVLLAALIGLVLSKMLLASNKGDNETKPVTVSSLSKGMASVSMSKIMDTRQLLFTEALALAKNEDEKKKLLTDLEKTDEILRTALNQLSSDCKCLLFSEAWTVGGGWDDLTPQVLKKLNMPNISESEIRARSSAIIAKMTLGASSTPAITAGSGRTQK